MLLAHGLPFVLSPIRRSLTGKHPRILLTYVAQEQPEQMVPNPEGSDTIRFILGTLRQAMISTDYSARGESRA